jgi:molecular chaperone IbpA
MTHTIGNISFGPLYHSTLGFDSIFRDLEKSFHNPPNSFPPHNIIKVDDNKYIVELAIAGYCKDDIDITVEDNLLTIKGEQKSNNGQVDYIHRGISTKKFTKTIRILDTVKVKGAEFSNGLLRVGLENVIPEHKKPIKIGISDSLDLYSDYNPQLLKE